ncbi:hypothetical protein K491DRAFT_574953, partial [Lophiostoma macrostomum CBS 122681]
VLSPLTTLFHFAVSVYYELATCAPGHRRTWHDDVSIRYRLARLCQCRLSSSTGSTGLPLGRVNPSHVDALPRVRSLKWQGRVVLLVIFLGQYIQATLLLTRRLLSNTAATIDIAMMCMILSGSVALTQSLMISFLNVRWIVTEPIQPCQEKACTLTECVENKNSQSLPSPPVNYTMFGLPVYGGARHVLHLLAGGHLQLMLVLKDDRGLYSIALSLLGIYIFWWCTIRIIV